MQTILDAANTPILLVGNCLVDQVMLLERYPAPDQEVRALNFEQRPGGNVTNSSMVLRQLGHPVELLAQLADDSLAEWVGRQLDAAGIDYQYCPRAAGRTPLSSVWVGGDSGSRNIAHYRDLPELDLAALRRMPLDSAAWLHIEGRNVAVLGEWLESLDQRLPKSLEIEKARPGIEALAPAFDCLILSSHYLRQTGMDARRAITRLASINPRALIVCTLGASGILARDHDARWIERPALAACQVQDSTGAGDAFIAGLVSRLACGSGFAAALDFAQRVALSKIQHHGMVIDAALANG
jgi:ketohexokinase